MLLGYSPTMLAGASFVLASLIASTVVILASPMIQLSSGVFTFGFLIPALGAALIGQFRYVWATVATGLGDRAGAVVVHEAAGRPELVPAVRGTRRSPVPDHHHRHGAVGRAPSGPRVGLLLEAPACAGGKGHPVECRHPRGVGDRGIARARSAVARSDHDLDDRDGPRAVARAAHRIRRSAVTGADVVRRRCRFHALEAGDLVGHPVPARTGAGGARRCGLRHDRRHPGAARSRDQSGHRDAGRWRRDQRVLLQGPAVRRRRVDRRRPGPESEGRWMGSRV